MKKSKRIWQKGDKFQFDSYIFVVKDVDIETFYQTEQKKYYLAYDRKVQGKYYRHWVDSDLVKRDNRKEK